MSDLNKSGIYKITNKINGKCYIGLAKNIANRWSQHKNFEVNDNSKKLYWAFQEYGIENFEFEVVKYCEPNKLAYWEKHFIEQFDSYKNGYNNSYGGEGGQTQTLSDKFDINYGIRIYDSLKYHDDSLPKRMYVKYSDKHSKKVDKFNSKKEKKQLKAKPTHKFEMKWNKKIYKIQLKVDFHKKQIQEIEQANNKIKTEKYDPVINFLQDRNWQDFSHEDFERIYVQTVSSKTYQRNHVKYKNYQWENTYANIKFYRNYILFKIEGFRDLKVELESIQRLNVTIMNDRIICYFNESLLVLNGLTSTTFLSSDKPEMPNSPLLIFGNVNEFKGFVSSMKRILGR